MSRFKSSPGIRSYKKAATLIAGSTLLLGTSAEASEAPSAPQASTAAKADAASSAAAVRTAVAATAAESADAADPVIVTGERYRINTLNSRLRDVREAPQTISIIPREIIEQQAATTLNDVLRNVSGISMISPRTAPAASASARRASGGRPDR